MRKISLGLSLLMIVPVAACDQNRKISPEEEKAKAHAKKAFQEFRTSMKYTLEVVDEKMDSLRQKAQKASGEARQNLEIELNQLQEQRKQAKAKLEKIGDTFSDNWDQVKDDVQKSVTDLKEAAEAAWKKLKD